MGRVLGRSKKLNSYRNNLNLSIGQILKAISPLNLFKGTHPKYRESLEKFLLSPNTKIQFWSMIIGNSFLGVVKVTPLD